MSVATIYVNKSMQGESTSTGAAGTTGTLSGAGTTSVSVGIVSSCSGVAYYNAVFAADFSSLAGKAVTAATFSYWIATNMNEANDMFAYLALDSWDDQGANPGPDYDLNDRTADMVSNNSGVYTDNSDAKWKQWIQKWIDQTIPNYGFVLDWVGSTTSAAALQTEEYTGTTRDPYFSVTYYDKPVMTPTGGSIPLAGDVPVAYTISIPSGGTLAQVAVRRKRLTGA